MIQQLEPLRKEYVLIDGCTPDIQFMNILVQTYQHYEKELTDAEIRASLNWFVDYMEAQLSKGD